MEHAVTGYVVSRLGIQQAIWCCIARLVVLKLMDADFYKVWPLPVSAVVRGPVDAVLHPPDVQCETKSVRFNLPAVCCRAR